MYKYQPKSDVSIVFVESGYPHWEVAKWSGSVCLIGPEWYADEAEARARAKALNDISVVFVEGSYPHWEVAKWSGPQCVVGPEWFADKDEAWKRVKELA